MMLTVMNCILIFQLLVVAQIPAHGSSFVLSYSQCRNRMSTASLNLLVSKSSKKSSNVAASLQGRITRTQLQMGLFQFFHKKNKSNDTNSNNNNNDTVNTKMDAEEWEQQMMMESASSYEPNPSVGPPSAYTATTTASSSSLLRETVQQRLKRMKSGEMTMEEKEAFLNTALGRISGNKNKPTNTTKIRQSLPLAPKRPPNTIDETTSSSISAEDSWSAVVSRKRMEQQHKQQQQQQQQRYDDNNDETKAFLKIELDGDEAAKQAWLNMVTSPTRFQSYVAVQKQQQQQQQQKEVIPENDSVVEDPSIDEPPNFPPTKQLQDLTDAKKRLQEQQKMFEQMATKSGESLLDTSPFLPKTTYNSSSSKKNTTATTTILSEEGRKDLASRLEQAAVLQEQRDAETRAALIKQQKESEQARLEQQRKLYEFSRQREEEFKRLEEIRLTKRREEEAQRLAIAQEKKKAEELKRMELERAQDEYWKKKLAQEKAFRESRMMSGKEKEEKSRLEELDTTTTTESLTKMTKDSQLGKIANLKNEMSLLEKSEETQKKAQEIVRNIIDSSAKSVSSTSSSGSSISGESFSIEEQIAKMDALKKLQKEQQEQLKSLSSIPGHSSGVHPLIATSSTAVSYPEEEEEEEEFTLDTSNPTGLTVGDILSGKVDPESVNVNELLLETKNEEIVGRKPIRQKLILDTTEDVTPPVSPSSSSTGSETSSTKSESRSGDAGWKISEEDKKKANKWGINIDKLL